MAVLSAAASVFAADPALAGGSLSVHPVAGLADLRVPAESRAESIRCLAQAIGYEAGNEPEEGQEAVAEVVLNRLRDPHFPKTICGVVFQGAGRGHGCQFTFTCDGSLSQRGLGRSWDRALAIAALAIDGRLTARVGGATHYHAYYVQPVWAGQLTRVARIGAHIFYSAPAGTPGSGQTGARAVPTFAGDSPAPEQAPRAATLSVWGLPTATITPVAGGIEVRQN